MAAIPLIGAAVGAVGTIANISSQKRAAQEQKKALSKQEVIAAQQLELQKQAIAAQKQQVLDEQKANLQQVELLKDQANYRRQYDNELLNQQHIAGLNQAALQYNQQAVQATQALNALDQAQFQAKQKSQVEKAQASSTETAGRGQAASKEQQVRSQTFEEKRGLSQQARSELLQFGKVLSDGEREKQMGAATSAARGAGNQNLTASGQRAGQDIMQAEVGAYNQQVMPVGGELEAQAANAARVRHMANMEKNYAYADAHANRQLADTSINAEKALSDLSTRTQRRSTLFGLGAARSQRDLSQANVNLGSKANRLGRSAEYLSEVDLLNLQRRQADVTAAARLGSLTRANQSAVATSQADIAGLEVQRRTIQSPGLFSYANAGLNFYNDLRGAGVFGSPSFTPPQPPMPDFSTGSSMFNTYTPPAAVNAPTNFAGFSSSKGIF